MKQSTFSHLRRWFTLAGTIGATSMLAGCLLLEEGNATTVLDLTEEQLVQIRALVQQESVDASEAAGIAQQVFDDELQSGLAVPTSTDWTGLTDVPAGFADNVDNVLMAGAGLAVDGDTVNVANGAITSEMLANGSVTTGKLANGSVANSKIVNGSITAQKIADGAIESVKLADGAVTADKLALGALDGNLLGNGTIDTLQIADGAITTVKLADGSVANSKIVNASITSIKIADGAVTAGKLAPGAVGAASLGDGAITTAKIADRAVTSAKLADGAVITDTIADGAITNAKLGPESVSNAKIGNQAVSTSKILPGAVTETRLGDGAVTAAKLADGAVSTAKLAPNAIDASVIPDDLALGDVAGNPGTLTLFDAAGTATVFVDGAGGTSGELVISDAAGMPAITAIAADAGTGEARLEIAGVVEACSSAFGGCDVAEVFELSDRGSVRPGAVLVLDADNPGHLRISNRAYDTRVAGVVSGAGTEVPGVRLGQRTDGSRDLPVALTGRVYVKVDTTDAAIEVGDMLTTSDRAGYAMKASDASRAFGAVLGKAMQPMEQGKTGEILVLVSLQ